MRSMILAVAIAAGVGGSAQAQAPEGPPAGRGTPGAEMLLARTGELALTDAQVTRLAAIARRNAARRQAMRASFDSIRNRFGPENRPDSATRRQLATRMRADAERMREQEHADRRDAIAVLTVDQQAKAWEMVANRGRAGVRASGMRGMRGEDRPMEGRQMRPMQPRRPNPPVH